MTEKRLYIKEDITDWRDEMYRAEVEVKSLDDVIDLRQKPEYTPRQVGQFALVSEKLGIAQPGLLPETKLLLSVAATNHLLNAIAARKTILNLANGKKVEGREFVANVQEEALVPDDGAEPSPPDYTIVRSNQRQGLIRAQKYLLNNIAGYVRGRLDIIAQDRELFEETVEAFRAKLDAMVAELQ